MVTVISRFKVQNGMEEKVREAFIHRPRLADAVPGFCSFNVMNDAKDPAIFVILTRWNDIGAFRNWHHGEKHNSHAMIPRGLKLDSSFTSLTVGNEITNPQGPQNLADALDGRTAALSHWLMELDTVFALLLSPDGAILVRNRASHQSFPPGHGSNSSASLWDYLKGSEAELLRQRLANFAADAGTSSSLNLRDGEQNSITLEFGLLGCDGAILLIGAKDQRHDALFQNELFKLTNDLTVMMRESAQKNRELTEANTTIKRLVRTDPLTGLANRRTLDEMFLREIARAYRMNQPLSLVVADLDRFKSINDQYGHLVGDQVLVAAAGVLSTECRPYDLAVRFGGEEFVLLLPGTSLGDAAVIAERIRGRIAALKIDAVPRGVTISMGVATWIEEELPAQLFARADAAVYRAKAAGRNRVECEKDVLAKAQTGKE